MTKAFTIDLGMAPGHSLRGLVHGLIERAKLGLSSGDAGRNGFHNERRCMKKLRAVLLLGATALDRSDLKAALRSAAATGRALSGARDQAVLVTTISAIEAKSRRSFDTVRTALAEPQAPTDLIKAERLARRTLQQTSKLVDVLAFDDLGISDIARGFGRTYRQARHGMRDAAASSEREMMHEWRKITQRHWRHLQVLSPIWPHTIGSAAALAGMLSDLLGQFQDISVVLERIERLPHAAADRDVAAFVAAAGAQQAALRATAFEYGSPLFSVSAKAVRRDLEQAWLAAVR